MITSILHAPLAGKLLRFAIVGVVVTASYSSVAYAGLAWLRLSPIMSSVLACSAAIVVSYLGQKYFTFRSTVGHQLELPKFLAACMIAVVASTVCLSVVTHAGWDFRIAILISALVLPLCNFTVMNLWVFAQTGHRTAELTHND